MARHLRAFSLVFAFSASVSPGCRTDPALLIHETTFPYEIQNAIEAVRFVARQPKSESFRETGPSIEELKAATDSGLPPSSPPQLPPLEKRGEMLENLLTESAVVSLREASDGLGRLARRDASWRDDASFIRAVLLTTTSACRTWAGEYAAQFYEDFAALPRLELRDETMRLLEFDWRTGGGVSVLCREGNS